MSGRDDVTPADPWRGLGRFTSARIALGRAGGSLPTRPMLDFQLSHARARDAVLRELDAQALAESLAANGMGLDVIQLHSAARDRPTFIARPDLGRLLDAESARSLEQRPADEFDCAFVIADGLSALAVERHAAAFLLPFAQQLAGEGWRMAPLSIVRQGRVAIGDEIGSRLGARLMVLLIGERPGLSSPDSLGLYMTYGPKPGRMDAERNCISNIRPPEGLSYAQAAHKLHYLMSEARRRKLSGVELKEEAPLLAGASSLELPA